uniref:Tetratricopeptide TPR_2 repeat protein n=1 Tax=mine drainage metagenome TaxID=410659 RepID=E6QQR6_9ZZZZ
MVKNKLYGMLLLLSVAGLSFNAWADNAPTLHQVYEAAQAGNLAQADQMMTVVLQQHPSSGKAHYVEAELSAKEGQIDRARSELATARQLAPGLPFARPDAVAALEARISGAPVAHTNSAASTSFPWGLMFFGLGAILLVFWIVRKFTARNPTVISPGPYYNGTAGGVPTSPYGGGSPMMPMGGGVMGGGMGSGGLMSNLVTGATMGAGMVAGEELAHHFLDGNRNTSAPDNSSGWNDASVNDNMGGNDFGSTDGGSWDDGSSGGGDFGGDGGGW